MSQSSPLEDDRSDPEMRKTGRKPRNLFDQCAAAYLNHLQVYGKATSRETAEKHIKRLRQHFGGRNPNGLTPDDITAYILWRRSSKLADMTIKRELGTLRAVLNRGRKQELIRKVVEITPPRVPKRRLPNILEPEEIEAVLQAATNDCVEGMLRVAFSTALRNSELRNLQWRDLDLESGLLRVSNKEAQGWSTKNRSERAIYLTPDTVSWLKRWKLRTAYSKETDWVFANRKGGRYTCTSVARLMRTCFQNAGVYRKGRRTLHAARSTVASHWIERGVGLVTVMELLGHADLATTQLYAFTTDKAKKDVALKINLLKQR